MRSVIPSALAFLVFHGAIWLMLRRGLPAWWKRRIVRALFGALAGTSGFAIVLWGLGGVVRSPPLVHAGMNLFQGVLTISVPLFLTLPISIVLSRGLSALLLRASKPQPATPREPMPVAASEPIASVQAAPSPAQADAPALLGRRRFIHVTSAAVPALAAAAGAGGLVMAHEPQKLPIIPMRYAGLPDALNGLRILHLSDLHLGYFMHVAELRACLERASALKPDLIVFTGDIADDLDELLPAMQATAEHKPRLGIFAALGNHEHIRGIARVRSIFDKSPVELLVERGTTLDVGGARLRISGIDDPVSLRGESRDFMKRTLARTLDGAPSDAFHLLMSHRPEGFDAAAADGIDLTLSGHTHGVQIGWNRRSLFESRYPERHLWGEYQKGKSRLYTSSGFGHWFPFRLNCPTEAPLIVLERA